MTTTPHLCAILAYGEPTFVIAEPMDIAGEEGWIVSLGGWRVFPYWNIPLDHLYDWTEPVLPLEKSPPDDWPDSVWKDGNDSASTFVNEAEARPLLEKIGLLPPTQPLVRRI